MKPSELLADPARWCRGSVAMDAEGRRVPENHPKACRWCAMGAIVHCKTMGVIALQEYLRRSGIASDIAAWNDDPNTQHADVLAALTAVGL